LHFRLPTTGVADDILRRPFLFSFFLRYSQHPLDYHSKHPAIVIPSEARNLSFDFVPSHKIIQAGTSHLYSVQPFLYCPHSMPCLRFTDPRKENELK